MADTLAGGLVPACFSAADPGINRAESLFRKDASFRIRPKPASLMAP
jgi:hypothetical protein